MGDLIDNLIDGLKTEARELARSQRCGAPMLDAAATELSRFRTENAALRLLVDPAICRLQFPDGSVPGNSKEAAEGWKRWYETANARVRELEHDLLHGHESGPIRSMRARADRAEAELEVAREASRMVTASLLSQAKETEHAEAECVALREERDIINVLREPEGHSVTLICDNPDFNGQPNCAIEVCGDWTDWHPRRFTGDTIIDALRKARTALAISLAREPSPFVAALDRARDELERTSPAAVPVDRAAFTELSKPRLVAPAAHDRSQGGAISKDGTSGPRDETNPLGYDR